MIKIVLLAAAAVAVASAAREGKMMAVSEPGDLLSSELHNYFFMLFKVFSFLCRQKRGHSALTMFILAPRPPPYTLFVSKLKHVVRAQ